IANTGTDEANHMLEIAGPWMRPGYLLPVFDLEAGMSQRTSAQLSQFTIDFSDRIFAVKGIRPLIYTNQTYANYVQPSVAATYPHLWIARWPNQSNPDAIDIQNGNPPPSPPGSNVYGRWNPSFPTIPNPQPWAFWQYASTIKVPGIGGGTQNVDGNVANGDIEFVKDFLVPALWLSDASGDFGTVTNWNTRADPSGQGPPARLPGQTAAGWNDTVILDRGAANVTVTVSTGSFSLRRLFNHETLALAGGGVSVWRHVRNNGTMSFSGGALTVTGSGSLENQGQLYFTGGVLSTPLLMGNGSLNVSAGSLSLARLEQNQLTIHGTGLLRLAAAGTTSVSVIRSLNSGGGQVDLGDEALVINYTGSSPINVVRTTLASGYNQGGWNGSGILSHLAAADPARRSAVGLAEATDIGSPNAFLGHPIDATSLLMRYTLYGDTNLSGTVDVNDFSTFAAHFNSAGRWATGDFNYDMQVGLSDFALLAANFNQSISGDLPRQAPVPEPGLGLALTGFAGLALTRCRGFQRIKPPAVR
ncbi:MAG: hypothetical protein NZ561_01755, partial [Phycisphaerae bacterium]|nr:hypothetical protein [Phycisphaerae bacterium]